MSNASEEHKPYVCPYCGNDRFQEVEYVPQGTPIDVWTTDGEPHYDEPDYDAGSRSFDGGSEIRSHVECSQCCASLPNESDVTEKLQALDRVNEILSAPRFSVGVLEDLRAIVTKAGVPPLDNPPTYTHH